MRYSFGPFELDTDLFELRRAGTPVPLEPQVFDVLAYLVSHRDGVVTKNDLLDNVWGDRFVSESALTTRIKAARRAVGDDGQAQGVIRTVHGRGYRFVAPVIEHEAVPEGGGAEAGARDGRVAGQPAAAADERWPLVGRAAELEQLAGWFRTGTAGGALLVGAAGMGKSRLAEECLHLAVAAGLPIGRAAGHPETRPIPFAALAHLLPGDLGSAVGPEGQLDRATVFHRARAALQDRAGDDRMLLAIDDADELDDLSRALVASLVQSRSLFAVLTMRSDGGPTPFDGLVKDGHLMRLAIETLPAAAVETLLHRVLGGPMVAESVQQLRTAASGNPGVLRQLVETAVGDCSLAQHDGVWRLSGSLQPTSSFEALVADRLAGLDDTHRHAAELLAVAGDVGLGALAAVAGDRVLEDLEQGGLLTVRTAARRTDVSLPHPLFSQVLLRQLPVLRARRLRRELAGAIEATGARRREDRVRLVAWRIDGGGDLDPDLVLHAARLAVLDGNESDAERLIRRAASDGAGARAEALLAELRFRQNRPGEVEAILAHVDLDDLDEADRARVVRRRSGNLFYGLTDPAAALEILEEALPAFPPESGAGRSVAAQRAIVLSMVGRVTDAHGAAAPLLEADDPAVRFEVLRAASLALAAMGRGEHALGVVAEAQHLYDTLDPGLERPGRSILVFNELFALTELGRLDEGRALGRRAAAAAGPGGRSAWLAFALPRIELSAGNTVAALAHGEPYALETRATGQVGAERWVLSLVGMARLLSGDSEGGARDISRVAHLWPQATGLFRSDRDRALGWLAADQGDLDAALRILQAGAADAGARGAYALEAMLLHDAVRFGHAGEVVDRLTELGTMLQGPFIAARVDHAEGIVAADCVRLDRAVDRFETVGSPLLAAEAAIDLAVACRSHGDRTGAADAAERSRRLLDRLEGPVVTPALVAGQAVVEVTGGASRASAADGGAKKR